MFVSDNYSVGDNGHLLAADYDTVALAKKFGTPLYVMDEGMVRRNCALYRDSINKFYDGKGMALFASKALCCREMCRIAADEGMGLDVVSGGEIYTAVTAGVDAKKLHFHGNNKTCAEIEYALKVGIGRFIADNVEELGNINRLAGESGSRASVLLRIKPGIDAHTHKFVQTGQIDSKFGFALETGEAEEAVIKASEFANIDLVGAACHIGSQIFDIMPFEKAAEVMIDFMADMNEKYRVNLQELDLGGGFGIKYVDGDDPIEYDKYMEKVSVTVKERCKEHGMALPFIYLEPGRSIVGEAGITLYTVGSVKRIPDIRTYVAVDGGMTDNPRHSLYGAEYDAVIADRAGEPREEKVTIAGRCCETDLLTEGVLIQTPHPGDTLAMFSTGAYNFSMASNYNRVPRPAMVMIKDGRARVVVKRESYEDIVRNDV